MFGSQTSYKFWDEYSLFGTPRDERIATQELEAGCCFVNAFVKLAPRLPFGDIKSSGYGRELSHYGIKEFANIKKITFTKWICNIKGH
jgi:acyl-CoA reductase-like NAD-dependent aldehyde dehydrogenase